METLTIYNVAEFTGEWVKNHIVSKKIKITVYTVYIATFLAYLLSLLIFGKIIYHYVLSLYVLVILVIVMKIEEIYKFVGEHSRSLQIKFVQSEIEQLKNNPVLCELEDDMLRKIREEVSDQVLIISKSHLIEIQSEIISEIDDRIEDEVMIYFAEKQRIAQELKNLESLLLKLTKKN